MAKTLYQNIVVAIDFEEDNQKVVDHATELAKNFNAKLWLLHIAAPDPDFVGYDVGPQYIRDFRADELKAEHRTMEEQAKAVEAKGIAAEPILIQGPTVAQILDQVDKLNAELLVMGSHDHGFLYNLLVGNTAVELVKNSRIPLLTIPI